MADLERIFDGLDRLDPEISWSDVRGRKPGVPPIEPERSKKILAIGVALVVAVAGISVALRAFVSPHDGLATPPSPGEVVRIPVGDAPQPIVADDQAAWVVTGTTESGNVVWRIDAASDRATELPGTRGAGWPAVGDGFAWVTCSGAQNPCGGSSVLKLDPRTGATLATIRLGSSPSAVTTGLGAVWVSTEAGLVKIDPVAAKVVATFPIQAGLLITAGGFVWASNVGQGPSGVFMIDPANGHIVKEVPFFDTCTLFGTDQGVWVASCQGGLNPTHERDALIRLDPATGRIVYRVPFANSGGFLTLVRGLLWTAYWVHDSHVQIEALDPATGRPTGVSLTVNHGPRPWVDVGLGPPGVFIAVGAHSFWLTHVDAGDVVRLGISAG